MEDYFLAIIILIIFVGFSFIAFTLLSVCIIEFLKKLGEKMGLCVKNKNSQSMDCELNDVEIKK